MARDKSGRFCKGNQEGTKFTSDNQPSNSGRKPSRFKQILSELDAVSGETISIEDYTKIARTLLSLTTLELSELIAKETTPIAVVLIGSAISGDIASNQMTNIEKLLDRIFGKTAQKINVETNAKDKPLTKEELARRREEIEKSI